MSAIRFLLIVAAIPPSLFAAGVQDSVAVDTARIAAARPSPSRGVSCVVRTINQDFFTNLPARGIDAAIVLQPGVTPQGANTFGEPVIAVRGGREGEIEYRLEGAPANDLIWGGRSLAITAEAVEQIQVHAGGPAAEFGGAGAGTAGMQLRTGRADRWSGSLLAETDRYTGMNKQALGGYSYGYSDWTGTAGGPFPGLGNVVRLFGSVQNTFYRDPTMSVRSGYNFSGANAIVTELVQTPGHSAPAHDTLNIVSPDGNATGGGENRWIMTGTALLDLSPLQVRVAGSYSYDRGQTPADLLNILNQSRLPLNIGHNGFFNARVTDAVSPAFSVEASFTHSARSFVTEDPQLLDNLFAYGDSAANAALGYRLRGSSLNWPAYQLWGRAFGVNQPGTQTAGYEKTRQESYSGRGGITFRVQNQEFKIGGEYTRYTLRDYLPGGVFQWSRLRSAYTDPAQLEFQLMGSSLNQGYGYDVYGREISADDVRNGALYNLGPRTPVIWNGYIQDRIDLSSVILSLGLRYDFMDPGREDLADPSNLKFSPDNLLLASQLVRSASFSQVSPRIGISVPLDERWTLHGQFGRYIEPLVAAVTYLKPPRTTQYEIGVSYDAGSLVSFDATGFYKVVTDQISAFAVSSPPSVSITSIFGGGIKVGGFSYSQVSDAVSPKGVEIAVRLRRTHRLAAQFDYTLQDVDATWLGSLYNSAIAGGGPIYFSPLYQVGTDFREVHRGSAIVDYRFGKDDGGAILERTGLNVLMTFNSGHYFTRLEPGKYSSTPWFFQLDGRLDRSFSLGPLSLDIYIYAINLLGTDNAVSAFARSGDASNDGWIASDAGRMEATANGQQYAAFYNAVQNGKNSGNWGPPRQFRFGVRLDY